jgi:hypothetical protein
MIFRRSFLIVGIGWFAEIDNLRDLHNLGKFDVFEKLFNVVGIVHIKIVECIDPSIKI